MSFKKLAPSFLNRLLTTEKNIGSGESLLDCGCADGEYSRFLSKKFAKIIGVDIDKQRIEFAKLHGKENCEYYVADAKRLPFPNESFTHCICVDVIEHNSDYFANEIVSELSRVIVKNGVLFLSTPNRRFPITYDPINWILKHFNRYLPIGIMGFGHERLYSDLELTELLEKNGFRVEKINYVNHYLAGMETYISSMFGYFLVRKSDKNVNREDKDPPGFIIKLLKACLWLDEKLFGWSKTSIGIMARAVKI